MAAFIDRTGQRFGKLTVVERVKNKNGKNVWRCVCDCGNETLVQTGNLSNGHTTSCGCARVESGKRNFIDLTGQKFNRLTVLQLADVQNTKDLRWLCRCDCGKETTVQGNNLKSGLVKSCGCYRHDKAVADHTTHGGRRTRLYRTWYNIRRRCYDKNEIGYENYGGRGITVCDEWRNSFETFRDWAFANGYSDDLTIDRVDVNGNYEPSNCRWATAKEQARNRRSNVPLTYNGETHLLIEWSEITDIPVSTIRDRYFKYNWTLERTLTEPLHEKNRRKRA